MIGPILFFNRYKILSCAQVFNTIYNKTFTPVFKYEKTAFRREIPFNDFNCSADHSLKKKQNKNKKTQHETTAACGWGKNKQC